MFIAVAMLCLHLYRTLVTCLYTNRCERGDSAAGSSTVCPAQGDPSPPLLAAAAEAPRGGCAAVRAGVPAGGGAAALHQGLSNGEGKHGNR